LHGLDVDVYETTGEATLNVYYLAEVVGGTARPDGEVGEIGWFGPDELPERIAFAHDHRVLAD
ncbi:MAG: hypothetical protein HYY04_05525, partial [Chloroflexi bacterium]|nr:hypothetical protein [Chloroflexota bacterium]